MTSQEALRQLIDAAPDFMCSILAGALAGTDPKDLRNLYAEAQAVARTRPQSSLQIFLADKLHHVPGETIRVPDLYDEFYRWLGPEPSHRAAWTKRRISAEMPKCYPKGRQQTGSKWCFGNLSLTAPKPGAPVKPPLVLCGTMLQTLKT